jgi:hypothetical protein
VRKNKPNARPMRVVAKANWFLVTLVGHEDAKRPIRVFATSKGHAYTKAVALFPPNKRPLAAKVEVERIKVRF